MITIISLYRTPTPGQEQHGERSFWRWEDQGRRYVCRFFASAFRALQPIGLGRVRFVLLTNAPQLCLQVKSDLGFSDPLVDVSVVPLLNVGTGWWSKLEAFRADVSSGKCWYSDLDNVITGDLSDYLALPTPPLVMLEDRYYAGMANGSNLLFDADHPVLRELWVEYARDPRKIEREFSKWPHASDQAFIADRVRRAGLPLPYAQGFLPHGYLLSGRDEVEKGADVSNCRLVWGAGDPKPHSSTHPIYDGWRNAA